MTLPAGTTLGAYRIESLLGRGGMGEVHLALQAGLGRPVALKLLAPELATDPRFRGRFIAESRLAASLDHPHIVPLYEAGEIDGRLFLAMRYVEGADLGALIERDGPLEPDRAIGLLRGVADALDAAHERGLVHRDVKPGNILVARAGPGEEHAYLADFGLVKHLGSDAGFTKTGQLVGSVDYVAPEQIEGRPIDRRVDGYSLAGVLYACLSGRPPYPRETELATLWAHVGAPPPRISDVRPELAALDPVIARGMAKEPAARYPSCRELLDAAQGTEPQAGGPALVSRRSAERRAVATPPAQLSSFIGREPDLAELAALLGDRRLITITGAGGTGKTRLALELAARVAERYDEGVEFVDLSALRDAELVPRSIATALSVRIEPDRTAEEALGAALAGRRALLVLDNFEQVVAAGPTVARLLAACPELRVVVTSRSPLRLRGEREYALAPLPVPDPDAPPAVIAASPAVGLFLARAADAGVSLAVTPTSAPTLATICRRLDGLPLAIELAAVRTKLFGPADILARLDHRLTFLATGARDLPDRQQTLRATIDWSHELLAAEEQVVFRRASVFAGGFTLDAADAVCGEPSGSTAFERLAVLVDQSLLRVEQAGSQPRYMMLETIREFASRRLAQTDEAETIHRRQAEYSATFAEQAEGGLVGPDQVTWLQRLDVEHDNLRAALNWSLEAGDAETGMRIAGAVWRFWDRHGFVREGRRWLGLLLKQAGPEAPGVRAKALKAEGALAYTQGDYRRAVEAFEESLQLHRQSGDRRAIASLLGNLGVAVHEFGDWTRAAALYDESLSEMRALGATTGTANMLFDRALLARDQGDLDLAVRLQEESLALYGELGDTEGEVLTVANLADAALDQSDVRRATSLGREGLLLAREQGDEKTAATCLEVLAGAAAAQGSATDAAWLFGAARAIRDRLDAPLRAGDLPRYHDRVAGARAQLVEARWSASWAAGAAAAPEEAIDRALAVAKRLGRGHD